MTVAGIEAHLSPHIKCFGHTINLATQKGLKCNDAARLLGRVRRVVSFFHRSTLANAVLKEKQKLLDLPPHKLIQDVITRWNSSFDMLERFLEQQAAVCATQLDQKIRKSMKNDLQTLNEDDISTAEEMIQLLRPVKTATTIMCEEAQPIISVIAPLKSKLIEHFSVCEDDMPLIKEMKQTMAKELEHRYTDVQEVLNTAAALDARFKTLPFLCEEERDATFKNIINEATQLWDQKEDTQAHDGTAMEETHTTHPSEEACDDELHASEYVPVSKKTKAMEDLFEDTYTASSNFVKTSKQLAEMEVNRYKETELLTLKGNLLEWWGSHEMEFPLLANLAKTYLCIPATSVPSEHFKE
ncbi:E3 SUMO-protein ligase ZBED1-like [Syngnathus acus]|uniref:E3 SUMO-protein ligase ZBED1-like n=1 Tax=Syngnathus acus TaxID=161584 RepID=UPI001885C600|nr:E3 SUMO-protein ligase ZBED1-like [Syngnathus acus]